MDALVNSTNASHIGIVKKHLGDLKKKQLPIYVFAATNHPERLDVADLSRRFPLKFHLKLPDHNERKRLFTRLAGSFECSLADADIVRLADKSEGLAVSDTTELFDEAVARRIEELMLTRAWSKVCMSTRSIKHR